MKKIYIIFSIFFSVFIFSSCSYGQKEYECIYCDGVNPGIQYKCNGYSYWYFKDIVDDNIKNDITNSGEYYIISSQEEALKHSDSNIINEVCTNNTKGFYNRNKLLTIYIKNKSFYGVYSIVNDNNKLVVILKTSTNMVGEYPLSTCVIQLKNSQYEDIDEIVVLEVDSNGNDIAILY